MNTRERRLASVLLASVLLPAVLLASALLVAGCAVTYPKTPPDGPKPTGSGPAISLSAALTTPNKVTLSWHGDDPDAAGRVVEFATDPTGQYSVLQFVTTRQTTFIHPDLMPRTTFYYRVRPYYGPASAAVDVALPPGDVDDNAHQDNPDWAAPKVIPHAGVATHPIRARDAAGTPTDLHATVMDANGISFAWTDHASDEEGYLIEVKPAGSADFSPVAVLDPDINSYGLVTLPTEKRASYRVRAFYYRRSSNIAHQTTGQDAG